jgi:hypothetical protein
MTIMQTQSVFEHLFAVISGERFIKKQGLGNEVPFFICPYEPSRSNEMLRLQRQLTNKLEQSGIRVIEINLYDLSVDILKERDIWNQIFELEPSVSKEELKELLQGVLDSESYLIPAIANKLAAHPILMFYFFLVLAKCSLLFDHIMF